jgi:hypothetical protein
MQNSSQLVLASMLVLFSFFGLPGQMRGAGVTVVSENFNALGTSATAALPGGWKVDGQTTTARSPVSHAAAGTATTQQATGGNPTTSGIYNFGSDASDRAVGWLATGTAFKNCNLYVSYVNSGAVAIDHFTVSFTGRKFKHNSNAAGFSLRLFTSTDDANWTEVAAGRLTWTVDESTLSPKVVVDALVQQTLEPGQTLYFAWNYCVTTGTTTSYAQGLGVDNVTITAYPVEADAPAVYVSTNALSGFSAIIGAPSTAQSFSFTGSNLTAEVTLTAPDGFELSWDGSTYAPSLTNANSGTIAPRSVQVRLAAAGSVNDNVAGNLSLAGGGLLYPVSLALTGAVLRDRSGDTFCEDFEAGSKATYASNDVTCASGRWSLDNMLLGTGVNDKKHDTQAVRGYGTVTMLFDKTNGVGQISIHHGMYGTDSAAGVAWTLLVSQNAGNTWTAYASAPQAPDSTLREVVFESVNLPGSVRIKVVVSGGSSTKRVNFDDICMTDYIAPVVSALPAVLNPFSVRLQVPAVPSAPRTFVVSGLNLSNVVVVAAPAGFAVSRESNAGYADSLTLPQMNGVVQNTTIHVRLTGAASGSFAGNVVVSSSGAAPVNVAVAGEVVDNLRPVLTGLPIATNTLANHRIELEVLASDTDGSVADLAVSSVDIPGASAGLDVQIEGGARRGVWSWTPSQAGTHTVTFTATDNEGGITACTVTIVVAPEWILAVAPGKTFRQSFDGIGTNAAAPLPAGWKVEKQASVRTVGSFAAALQATEKIGGNALASNAPNGIYNFGAGDEATASDRAVGFLSSSSDTKSGSLMVCLVNRSKDPIPGFTLAFDVEKYRSGTNVNGFAVQVYASPDGETWSEAGPAARVSFPADAVTDGYNPAPGPVATAAGGVSLGKLRPGESLYLAWNYSVAGGTYTAYAQALAIDDIVIKADASPQTVLIVR